MNKIILFCVLSFFLLNSCTETRSQRNSSYERYHNKAIKSNLYSAKAQSVLKGGWAATTDYSQQAAVNKAVAKCNNYNKSNDCVPHTIGNRYVFEENKKDYIISSAQNTCARVGYTEGTESFADCTLKMITKQTGQNQTVVIGNSNRQRLLRPYPLGCRSMGGNWGC